MVPFEAALSLALVASVVVALLAHGLRVVAVGRDPDPRLAGLRGPLAGFVAEAAYRPLRGVGRLLARTGLSPDVWTLVSALVTGLSLPLAATGRLAAAGVALLVGAAFDAIDGVVARQQGVASPAGAMLDSFVDRYADAAPLVGLALFFRASALRLAVVLATLVGSMLVSYARARAEGLGLDLPSGLMRRHERVVALVVALLAAPLFDGPALAAIAGPAPVTFALVALTGVLSNVAAVQLLAAARARLRPPR